MADNESLEAMVLEIRYKIPPASRRVCKRLSENNQMTPFSFIWNTAHWTPNKALASILNCKPEQCVWVWDSKEFANKTTCEKNAFIAARDKQRDL